MNTRNTFNGKKPKRQIYAPAALLMAVVIVLAVITVAGWIGVIGLYASDDATARHAVKGNDFKDSQVQPLDLDQGKMDDGGYKWRL